ncbi:Serine-threonine/tyrosine-protein kinase, catalytic domain [Dillenia turbinata]|uniref:non-specific serine/threonine protein kinase n=1 Tax=Dillenia turbinata TaxID=194707 RepID=A0AAN8VD01_9MAGN
MEFPRISFHFLISVLNILLLFSFSKAQLSPTESTVLFQIQRLLEYPPPLQGWTNWTNFCYLPYSPSLSIVCNGNHITELTVVGNKSSPSQIPKPNPGNFKFSQQTLSDKFSLDSLFTTLTRLPKLRVLSFVSLGLWGPLPAKISRISSLEVLNISSNFIYGEIPQILSSMKNLKSLVLADNMLNGSLPDLSNLQSLQELDLGNNYIGPKFPSLPNRLVTLVLSNNSIRSQIPPEIKNFDLLQKCDVSSNQIMGLISISLFSLPSVQYINIAKNQFSGSIPMNLSCNDKLYYVDISNNLFTGNLPTCLRSSTRNKTVLSFWNCLSNTSTKYQHPYSFCHNEALAVKPPSAVKAQENESSNIKTRLILGIIGGILGFATSFLVIVLVVYRRVGSRNMVNNKFESYFGEKSPAPVVRSRHVPSMRLASLCLPAYNTFTLEEIEDATNNFDPSNLIGEGSQGQLYRGWLEDGSAVIIRCIKLRRKNSPQGHLQHMDVLSKLRHRHLVSILGHCVVTYQDHPSMCSTVLVVHEHISNESLRTHLSELRKREMLKWPQRMAITIGIARGVQFLHAGNTPGIYGNDLNIENILLDASLTAKISNYNLPLPFKLDSESPYYGQEISNRNKYFFFLFFFFFFFFQSSGLCDLTSTCSADNAEKDDIYQLGVILLEVITGKVMASESKLEQLKLLLESSINEAPAKLREMTDPAYRGTYAYQSLRTAVEITINCLSKDSSKRPSIEDVLWNLQYAIQVQEGWTSSESLSTRS